MAVSVQAINNAKQVALKLIDLMGWEPSNVDVLIAQFILEKGWDWWESYPDSAVNSNYNFGNAGDPLSVALPEIASERAGITLYATVVLLGNPQAYGSFDVQMLMSDNVTGAADALSVSTWCEPPYGAALLDVLKLVEQASGNVVASSESPAPQSREYQYTVQTGDSLWSIASDTGTTVTALKRLNPAIRTTDLIVPGQVLDLPH